MSGQLTVPAIGAGAGPFACGGPDALAARLGSRLGSGRLGAGRLPATGQNDDPSGWPRVLFIDGRSGSGKTSLAESLASAREANGWERPHIVGMDELYPGWDGLAAGSAAVPALLLSGAYRRYDWYAKSFTPEVEFDRAAPLIVEGCGSISARALAVARSLGSAYAVWVECPATLRRERALARDGETFIPHWERWAEQEVRHFAITQPVARAHEVLHVAG
ncbi:hypothetical protein ACF07D_01185 [Leucobacter sp. NPDC015123]|uniref:hypothetical protein n=1 Tax=Leucobacter sp. NPDC015123 TaxID=3364129 RepID=UPI0036F47DA4